jgi:hypothetical protein
MCLEIPFLHLQLSCIILLIVQNLWTTCKIISSTLSVTLFTPLYHFLSPLQLSQPFHLSALSPFLSLIFSLFFNLKEFSHPQTCTPLALLSPSFLSHISFPFPLSVQTIIIFLSVSIKAMLIFPKCERNWLLLICKCFVVVLLIKQAFPPKPLFLISALASSFCRQLLDFQKICGSLITCTGWLLASVNSSTGLRPLSLRGQQSLAIQEISRMLWNPMCITTLTTTSHWSPSWDRWIQSTHPLQYYSPIHVLGFLVVFILQIFYHECMHFSLLPCMLHTLSILDFFILISSSCNFLHTPQYVLITIWS